MGIELFMQIIDQIDINTAELLVLHSDGEPLLNSDIFSMIQYAKQKGFKVMTSTNAMLLTQENAHRLIGSGLDVLTISLDGTSKEVYETIRKGGDYETVTENIEYFIKQKGNSSPFTIMQMIQMKENENQANDFINRWGAYKKQNVYAVIKPMVDWFNKHDDIITKRNCCDRPWFGLVIHSNGSVVPCVHDFDKKYAIGNVKDSSIYSIWNSPRMVELRENIVNGQCTNVLCRDCNVTSPTPHNLITDIALTLLDMASIAKLLPVIGYNRPKQY